MKYFNHKNPARLLQAALLVTLVCAGQRTFADVTVPGIFSEHMVLQKTAKVPVWGWAASGEEVTVSVAGQTVKVTAGENGKWMTTMNLADATQGPFEMTIEGKNKITIPDVVIGEVWLASGQSNMELPMSVTTGADKEAATSENPLLRQFFPVRVQSPQATDQLAGKWTIAGRTETPRFSAICYYFGKMLNKELGTPVGMINSSIGGTFIEAWMSQQAIDSDPDLKTVQQKAVDELNTFPARLADYATQYHEWEKKNNRVDQPKADPAAFAAPSVSTSDWKTIKLPAASFASLGLPDAGVIWIRRDIDVPAALAGHSLRVDLGGIHDFMTAYWEGEKFGEVVPETPPGHEGRFTVNVPGKLVKAGKNVLAVRIFSPRGASQLTAGASGSDFRVIAGRFVTYLEGDWLAKAEYSLPALDPAVLASVPQLPPAPRTERNISGYNFNAMIYPIAPYGIRGFLWYQGEANISAGVQYRTVLPLLIRDWRSLWKQDDLPFYLCQIANFGPHVTTPRDSDSAELREAQTMATLNVPKTGEAILIDIGEEKDIHPRNKKAAAERLAQVALAETYGKAIPHAGPLYQSMKVEGDKVRITLANADGGLVAKPLPATYQYRSIEPAMGPLVRNSPNSPLEGFAICGSDHKWVWANASIDGSTIIVSAPGVSNPVAVRYAWADNPFCNLYNGAGFPAVPFRTDNFPGITRKRAN